MENGKRVLKKREYLAFISYRHEDNKEKGRKWATWLHQYLEKYQIPPDLIGTKNLRDEIIPDRIFPIFRDEEELPADADLESSITNALANSRLLIVICSPNSVASTYVEDEIRYFKKIGRADRIIALMIDGEPNASIDKHKQEKEVRLDSECFPLSLQYEVDTQGNITKKRVEPIAADFRVFLNGKPEQGWTNIDNMRSYLKSTRKYNDKSIKEIVKNYQNQQELGLLKIIAGVLGVPLGELTKRDRIYQLDTQRKKTRTLRRWLLIVTILSIFAVISGLYAFSQKTVAIDQRDRAENAYGQALMEKAIRSFQIKVNNDGQIYGAHALARLKSDSLVKYSYDESIAELKGLMLKQPGFKKTKILNIDNDFISKIIKPSTSNGLAMITYDGGFFAWKKINNEYIQIISSNDKNATSISYSSDGVELAIGSGDGNIFIFDAVTGDNVLSLNAHEGAVHSVSFSPDENIIASSSADFKIKLWNTVTGDLVHILNGHDGNVFDIKFSPDGSKIYSTGWDKQIIIWDVNSKNKIKSIELDYIVFGIRYSPTNNLLALRSADNYLRLVDAVYGHEMKRYNIDEIVLDMEFSSCGNYILLAGVSSIHIFDLNTHDKVFMLINDDAGILAANFEPLSNSILTAQRDAISIWQMPDFINQTLINTYESNVLSTIVIEDRDLIISGGSDSIIRLWNTETKDQIRTFSDKGWVDSFAYSNGGILASSGRTLSKVVNILNPKISLEDYIDNDNKISLWDIQNLEFVSYLEGHESDVTSMVLSHSDDTLLSGDTNGYIIKWDLKKKKILNKFKFIDIAINSLSYSYDGGFLAIGYDNGEIILLNPEDFSFISSLNAHKYSISGLSFTPDGSLLVSADDDGIKIWNHRSRELLRLIEVYDVRSFSISPDSQFIASGGIDNAVRIWSVREGKNLITLKGHSGNITNVHYSPDGKSILSSGLDGYIKKWHVPENIHDVNWKNQALVNEYDFGVRLDGIHLVRP